jgi:signal transduction histidine kinase
VHIDPEKVALAEELFRRWPPSRDNPSGLYAILQSRQSLLSPDLSKLIVELNFSDPEQLAIARQLQLCSLMIVPLVARDWALGAMSFVMAESGRHYTASDLALAEELARRTALALDNALLYEGAQRLNADLEQHVAARAAQIEMTYARLKDEIAERRQAEEQIHLLNTQLEKRVAERTEQWEVVNRELQKEIGGRQQTDQTLRTVLRRTRELYRISQTIGSVHTPDEILAALLSSSYLTAASRASIAIFTGPFDEAELPFCEILAAWNKEPELPNFVGERLTLEETGLLPPYISARPIVIEDVQTKRQFSRHVRQRFEVLKTRSLILFPLIARGAWYGLLSLHFKSRRAIKFDDLRHISGLVDQTAIAIDNICLLAAEAKARHEAEEANDVKMKFLAMISHELRTPLTSIKGFITTLLADDVEWQAVNQRDFLQTVDKETDKLGDLIEQLLDLSRLEAGTLRIAPKLQAMEQVLATALAPLQTMTVNHRLILKVPRNLPLVHADAERISQVLTNIVGNAARYAPEQTLIAVTAQRMNGTVQIDVSDEGPGIPPEARARIFEPFEQVDRLPAQQTGGAGLGLAICKGLVEAHGGRIWVQERTEPGTTISFTLPVPEDNAQGEWSTGAHASAE